MKSRKDQDTSELVLKRWTWIQTAFNMGPGTYHCLVRNVKLVLPSCRSANSVDYSGLDVVLDHLIVTLYRSLAVKLLYEAG